MPGTGLRDQQASVTERLDITEVSPAQAERAGRPAARWTLADFAAYVAEEIARIHGPQLPCRGAEAILAGFWNRHGPERAVRVARAAFEVSGGMWAGAPVTVRRFTESNDPFFAVPILEGSAGA